MSLDFIHLFAACEFPDNLKYGVGFLLFKRFYSPLRNHNLVSFPKFYISRSKTFLCKLTGIFSPYHLLPSGMPYLYYIYGPYLGI